MIGNHLIQVKFIISFFYNKQSLYYYELINNCSEEDAVNTVLKELKEYNNFLDIQEVKICGAKDYLYLKDINKCWYVEYSIGDKVIFSKIKRAYNINEVNDFMEQLEIKYKTLNKKDNKVNDVILS